MSVKADPKPAKRIVDPDTVRRYLLMHPWCEAASCINPAWHAHHVLYRSQGGDDVDANLLSLCGDHHAAVHQTRDWPLLAHVRQAIEQREDVIPYLIDKRGGGRPRALAFLGMHYPDYERVV